MTNIRTAGLAAFVAAALPAAAHAEFVGGRAAVAHSTFVDDTSMAKSTAEGAVEFSFGSFGLQTDLGVSGLNALSETATNMTTHAIWNFSPDAAAGLYYGADYMGGAGEDFLGVEYARRIGDAKIEAYIAGTNSDAGDATLVGIAGSTPVGFSGLDMGLSVDHASVQGGNSATKVGLTGGYALGESTRLVGEIGSVGGAVGASETSGPYVKLGVDFRFGANHGTTFGTRSVFSALPGL